MAILSPAHWGTGTTYYRLKMKHSSGNISWSPVVKATVKITAARLQVYSNPVKNQLTIRLNAQPVANASAEIVSLSGTVLKTIRLTTQQSVVDVSAMPAGVYMLRYTDNDHIQTIRITKQLNRRLKNT